MTWSASRYSVVAEQDAAGRAAAASGTYPIPESLRVAVPRRLASFLAGRATASAALCTAGCGDWHRSVSRAESGAPLWPTGWVGSISHTDALCVSAVAKQSLVSCLGVDCELIMSEKIAEEVVHSIAPELRALPREGGLSSLPFAVTLAFAAKEALFKALFPMVGEFFGFEAAYVERMDADGGELLLRLSVALSQDLPAGRAFVCRWTVFEGHVIALVEVTSPM
ncbi:MAG: 4'-phosphopantetheinyl transferase superfamily protein [Gemmatimonadaceae bacterium]|nr:4'-phosphopantetheinyl transferase superfamily protein [Gemmatimonadaceae bacterium]